MIDVVWLLPGLLSAILALPLAYLAWRRLPYGGWQLAVVFSSSACVHGAYAVALGAAHAALPALQVAFAGSILQGALLGSFCKRLLYGLEGKARRGLLREVFPPLAAAMILGLALVLPQGLYELEPAGLGRVAAGGFGQLACGGLLLELLFGIAGLEQLMRRVRDPLHYQLKFLLLGLGLQAALSLYTVSTFLLRAVWRPEFALAHSTVNLLGLALAGFGLHRLRQRAEERQLISSAEPSRPLSFAVAGLFLLAMGIAGALLPRGATMSEHVLVVTVTAATGVALAVVLASRYVRTVLKRLFARTFRKSKYDYRSKWLEVIQAFHGVTSVDAILDRLPGLLGRTFSAGRISVWLQSGADGRFHQVRSVNVEAPPPPLEASHPLIVAASKSPAVIRHDDPVALHDEFCEATQMRVVGPIWGGRLLGLVVLSDDAQKRDYDQDDVDLLHAVSNHVGVLIAYAELAAAHRVDAEIRALHELSMFCIHDLKNLAGRLSLVAQNAKRFGDNPEFQRSALRTVATTGERMMSLIHKLSVRAGTSSAKATNGADTARGADGEAATTKALASGSEEAADEARAATTEPTWDGDPASDAPADLFETLESATETAREGIELWLPEVPEPRPIVRLPKEALRNVLLNIITNAEQAMGAQGRISILVDEARDQWVVTVRDNGPGIAPRALAKLFEPFGSTKPSGMGVGLFQCRRTLEATGGSIVVESQLGHGTAVRLCLPAALPSGEVARR